MQPSARRDKYPSIALIGRARSGKDTVAARLIERFQYTRVAFADPLKDMALRIDPWIDGPEPRYPAGWTIRLSDMVEHIGWERAKDEYPEVRRILQHVGQTVRDLDFDFWVRVALEKISAAKRWNLPVVVTDCRYPNEAETLKAAGFKLVRIVRPDNFLSGVPHHESETALADWPVDEVIHNISSLGALHSWVEGLPYMHTHDFKTLYNFEDGRVFERCACDEERS
ncbi:hypothetical protein [Streptomyces chattanoogensis]|uniref:deoxynucleotide monophosphate kinase family protein n=1 Tax=Streptomyces chattanoogensis TaxID=66876 RepID=UPI00369D4798